MPKKPEFDLQEAHKYFSAFCFNSAWDLIDKADKTDDEYAEMVRLAQVSIWHWTKRDDCTDRNLSVGYWQASRVFALIGNVSAARWYGEQSLEKSKGDEPFYVGYAYEALARAERLAGNEAKSKEYLEKAKELAGQVKDAGEKKYLVDDLATI